jgi:hypothetical protein
MAILDKQREMEYTKKLKENELVVYKATPEQIKDLISGGKSMGRPKGSKNNNTTFEMATEQVQKRSPQKKSEKVQAIKDLIMEEAEARKNKVEIEINGDVKKLPEEVIKANPTLIAKADPKLLKGAVEAVSPRLPIIEPAAEPAGVESDFRGKLLSSIKKAALSACLEEIAECVTGINHENMNEKLKGIRGTVNVVLEELEFHEI